MTRIDVVAAAFAAGGRGAKFDLIRVQKLLFLIDRVVSERIGGPFFAFRPYLFGPFDQAVYDAIRDLAADDRARTDASGPYPHHLLTEDGYDYGEEMLRSLPAPVADYFQRAAIWVLLMPYRQMLAAIHYEYPEMATKSVIRDSIGGVRSPRAKRPLLQGMASAFDLLGVRNRAHGAVDGAQADRAALSGDWRAVGADIQNVMAQLGKSEGFW